MRQSPKQMRLSDEGRVSLVASEGVVPAVYMDSARIPEPTWGVGVTKWAIGDEAFSQLNDLMPSDIDAMVDQALDLFVHVVKKYEDSVRNSVTVPLYQHEFDALVHFTYNVGGANLKKSRLLRLLNAGDYQEAGASGFHGWLRPKSLLSRRDLERAMFLEGDYGEARIPVYQTDGNRRLILKPIKTLSRVQALEMLAAPKPALVGASPVKRESVDQTATAFYAKVQKWLGSGGLAGLGGLSFLKDLDPTVQLALVGVGVLAVGGGIWLLSSLIRREREKHFLAGVK